MNYHAILSHQNSVANKKEVFVIDGVKSEYQGLQEQIVAKEKLSDTEGMKELLVPLWLRFKGVSKNFKMYLNPKKGLLVSSHFLTNDEAGRAITYAFFCDKTDMPAFARRVFNDYCSVVGMKPKEADSMAIEKLLNLYLKRKAILTVSIAVLILLIILILLLS